MIVPSKAVGFIFERRDLVGVFFSARQSNIAMDNLPLCRCIRGKGVFS